MEQIIEQIRSMPTKQNEIYIPDEDPKIVKQGIGEILFEAIKKKTDLVAQIDAPTGRSQTYKTLFSNSIKIAQNLRLNGISSGDVISVCSYNNLEYSAIVLASFFTGIINAPMDATAPLCDLVHCLKLTCPKVIFCEEELEKIIETAVKDTKLSTEIVVFGKSRNNTPYNEYLILREPEESFKIHKVSDVYETACIHFSSGTTGLPKAVCVNHCGLSLTVLERDEGQFIPQRVMIATSPFWLSNSAFLIGQVIKGDTRIVVKQFDEKTVMKYVQDYKVQTLFITPVNGAALLEHPEYYKDYDISSLNVLVTAGSLTSPKQFNAYAKAFPGLLMVSAYGMTEAAGLILGPQVQVLGNIEPVEQACIGVALPGIRYKVVDPETEEILGPNKEGELRCKSVGLFQKYYNNPKATAEAFDKDGFLKTGDIVYYDEELSFYYETRIKDIFKYKGWHISPTIIEKELLEHPNVKEAIVFGVRTDIHGEYPTAAVTVYDKKKFNKKEMKEFIQARLPDRYHLEGGIFVIEKIPRTSTGKIKRRYLAELSQNVPAICPPGLIQKFI